MEKTNLQTRREFLKLAGVGLAGLLGACLTGRDQSKKIRNLDNKTKITPEEKLRIAIDSKDNREILRESLSYVGEKVSGVYPNARVENYCRYLGSTEYNLVTKEGLPLVNSRVSPFIGKNILEVYTPDERLYGACREALRLINGPDYEIHSRESYDREAQLIY